MTTYLAWVKTMKGTYPGPGTGYILVLAEDREEAKKKVAEYYKMEYPEEVIIEIRIGITII